MPANLTPQYLEVEKRYREAKDPQEKLELLKEMLATIPKHKGTEKLQADIKKRTAKLQDLLQKREKVGRKGAQYLFPREGAGQIALIGPPNSGKSSIVAVTTHARPEVESYPFTTWTPTAGMMPFEDIQFQLIDTPPLSEEHNEPWLFDIVRKADLALLVVDISDKPLDDIEGSIEILGCRKIMLTGFERTERPGFATKKAIIIGNKLDLPDGPGNAGVLEELYGDRIPLLFISTLDGDSLESLKAFIFLQLAIVRVYTKTPGKKPEFDRPYIVPAGSTVHDIATLVHHDIARSLSYARIWGEGKEGLRIPRDYVVRDKDILEFHI